MLRGLKPKSTIAISVMFTSLSIVYSLKVPCWRMLTSWVYCWKAWLTLVSVLFCTQQHQLQFQPFFSVTYAISQRTGKWMVHMAQPGRPAGSKLRLGRSALLDGWHAQGSYAAALGMLLLQGVESVQWVWTAGFCWEEAGTAALTILAGPIFPRSG